MYDRCYIQLNVDNTNVQSVDIYKSLLSIITLGSSEWIRMVTSGMSNSTLFFFNSVFLVPSPNLPVHSFIYARTSVNLAIKLVLRKFLCKIIF